MGVLYLIRDVRDEGERVLWWRSDSAGYTYDLDQAGRYLPKPPTFSEEHHIWTPLWVALAAARREVGVADLTLLLQEITAGLALAEPVKEAPCHTAGQLEQRISEPPPEASG